MKKRKKFYAHDETGQANVGDVVRIVECRPLSKLKRWVLGDIIRRAAVVDLDVHQGNGTHFIFGSDPGVFTFSMHGGRNYPFRKVPGDLDLELDDGTGDSTYLEQLAGALPRVIEQARPDLVLYLAGADPHEEDRLGRLTLTSDGLARRDAMVLEACRDVGIPVAIVIAGGYGANIATTVEVHRRTVLVARQFA